MVNTILTGAGFVLNKTYKETRFLRPPRETFAVYHDSYEARGSDDKNLLEEHDISIELYEYTPDPDAEKRIETELDTAGIEYTKEHRYWIQEEQLYQVIYDFSYIQKRRI